MPDEIFDFLYTKQTKDIIAAVAEVCLVRNGRIEHFDGEDLSNATLIWMKVSAELLFNVCRRKGLTPEQASIISTEWGAHLRESVKTVLEIDLADVVAGDWPQEIGDVDGCG